MTPPLFYAHVAAGREASAAKLIAALTRLCVLATQGMTAEEADAEPQSQPVLRPKMLRAVPKPKETE